jgi:hypothetical protein
VKLIPDPFPLRASLGILRCLRLAFFLPSVSAIHALGAFRVSLKKSSAQLHSRAGRVGDQQGPAPEQVAHFGTVSRVHFHVPKAGGLQPADQRQDESFPGPLIIHSSVKRAALAVVLGLNVQMLCDDGAALEVNC